MRYRWELSHQHSVPIPPYAAAEWRPWRPGEQGLLDRDRFAFESRLLLPIVLTENAELLLETAARDDEPGRAARALIDETAPVLRLDFASFVQGMEPWQDTFALFCLVRRPRALALLHPLAVAIAACYAADRQAPVRGKRFPFHDRPLVSASAQLAEGLLALGFDLDLAASLITFVAGARQPSGGWGDGDAPADILTTFVAADLLSSVDPAFDLAPTVGYLESLQGEDGLWRALGPDAPWLTAEVLGWLVMARRPFADRFRWPFVSDANCDRKTTLPFYAYFADLARLFSSLSGLGAVTTELAFIDLAAFRAFNNLCGQERGDAVLRGFARALAEVRGARAIRDGGDEFMLVGAPTRIGLRAELESFRLAWPSRFRDEFGGDVPVVSPRILVARTPGTGLLQARERLGREIGSLKNAGPLGPEGVLVELER
jgi:GGDEF domain-containing protein